MNERTRQKKLRRARRWMIGGTLALIAVSVSLYLLETVDNFRMVPGSTVAYNVKAEKVTAQPVSGESAPSLHDDPAPRPLTPISTPEPTTLMLLAPTAIVLLRRKRHA